jgi:hypothetical protein
MPGNPNSPPPGKNDAEGSDYHQRRRPLPRNPLLDATHSYFFASRGNTGDSDGTRGSRFTHTTDAPTPPVPRRSVREIIEEALRIMEEDDDDDDLDEQEQEVRPSPEPSSSEHQRRPPSSSGQDSNQED